MTKVDAGIRSGVFIALATFLRPIGGILGDKFNAVKVLMIDFVVMIIGAIILGISDHIALFTVGCLAISICAGIGNGLIFKLVPSYFLMKRIRKWYRINDGWFRRILPTTSNHVRS
ncbi:hypothetical protein ACVPOQ_06215 [Staphylococcus aureus]